MKITHVKIKNFRLLRDVNISLEESSTVIVGRNNSGKTSLTEVFRRLLTDKTPAFSLHDFNISSIKNFKDALTLKISGAEQDDIRKALPSIEIKLTISYKATDTDLGLLSDFIIDLNPNCTDVNILTRFQLGDGKIDDFFDGLNDDSDASKGILVKNLKELIPD